MELYDRLRRDFFVIAGPCVIESRDMTLGIAKELVKISEEIGVTLVFKASYDKANRTSVNSYRGPGIKEGLNVLAQVKEATGLPVLSDVHSTVEVSEAKGVLDVIQIPAFLCRQTDLLLAAGDTGLCVNIKKGQFLAPHDMRYVVEKVHYTGNRKVLLTERGSTFGYNNLVVDMRSIPILATISRPVVFDATHSVQLPGGGLSSSGGERWLAPFLAKAAVAAGADGVFMEVHPDPDKALCDGPNSVPLRWVPRLIRQLKEIYHLVRRQGVPNGMD